MTEPDLALRDDLAGTSDYIREKKFKGRAGIDRILKLSNNDEAFVELGITNFMPNETEGEPSAVH